MPDQCPQCRDPMQPCEFHTYGKCENCAQSRFDNRDPYNRKLSPEMQRMLGRIEAKAKMEGK